MYGEWSEFGNWSDCSAECGGGSQFRLRDCDNPTPADGGADCEGGCDNPTPADGGADCEGGDTETKDCNTQHCPGNIVTL